MRRAGSLLVMLLLLIAYGRCVADQSGILHTSGASCCQVVCEDAQCADAEPAHHGGHEPGPGGEQPAPCQLCQIISTDGATFDGSIKVPAPQVAAPLDSADFARLIDHILALSTAAETDVRLTAPRVRPPDIQTSQWLLAASRTAPVRGPSLA